MATVAQCGRGASLNFVGSWNAKPLSRKLTLNTRAGGCRPRQYCRRSRVAPQALAATKSADDQGDDKPEPKPKTKRRGRPKNKTDAGEPSNGTVSTDSTAKKSTRTGGRKAKRESTDKTLEAARNASDKAAPVEEEALPDLRGQDEAVTSPEPVAPPAGGEEEAVTPEELRDAMRYIEGNGVLDKEWSTYSSLFDTGGDDDELAAAAAVEMDGGPTPERGPAKKGAARGRQRRTRGAAGGKGENEEELNLPGGGKAEEMGGAEADPRVYDDFWAWQGDANSDEDDGDDVMGDATFDGFSRASASRDRLGSDPALNGNAQTSRSKSQRRRGGHSAGGASSFDVDDLPQDEELSLFTDLRLGEDEDDSPENDDDEEDNGYMSKFYSSGARRPSDMYLSRGGVNLVDGDDDDDADAEEEEEDDDDDDDNDDDDDDVEDDEDQENLHDDDTRDMKEEDVEDEDVDVDSLIDDDDGDENLDDLFGRLSEEGDDEENEVDDDGGQPVTTKASGSTLRTAEDDDEDEKANFEHELHGDDGMEDFNDDDFDLGDDEDDGDEDGQAALTSSTQKRGRKKDAEAQKKLLEEDFDDAFDDELFRDNEKTKSLEEYEEDESDEVDHYLEEVTAANAVTANTLDLNDDELVIVEEGQDQDLVWGDEAKDGTVTSLRLRGLGGLSVKEAMQRGDLVEGGLDWFARRALEGSVRTAQHNSVAMLRWAKGKAGPPPEVESMLASKYAPVQLGHLLSGPTPMISRREEHEEEERAAVAQLKDEQADESDLSAAEDDALDYDMTFDELDSEPDDDFDDADAHEDDDDPFTALDAHNVDEPVVSRHG